MTDIKGIIFDLDGTLIDTIEDIGNSVNAVLEDYGYPTYTKDEYKLMVGHGFMNLIKRAMPEGLKEDQYEEGLLKFTYYYDKLYMDTTHPYEGIYDLLKELNRRGIKIAVNSNKQDDYTKKLIEHCFKGVDFVDVIGSRNNIPNKPDPTSALEIIDKMQLAKDEVIYIGDSETDIKTGKNANLKTIGVSWGFRSVEVLESVHADVIVNKPQDILAYLERGTKL